MLPAHKSLLLMINRAQNNVRPSSCSLDAAECRCDELGGGTFYCYIGYHILIMVNSRRPVVSSFGRVLAWRGRIFIARSLHPCCCCTFEFELVDRRHILIIWSIVDVPLSAVSAECWRDEARTFYCYIVYIHCCILLVF